MENRWENNGNSERLFSWAPKSPWTMTAVMKLKDACSLEKNLWKFRVLKNRGIILVTKVHIVKAMISPLVMYRCESGTIKAEHWTIHAFKLSCWRRLLRVRWTARRSNQPIIKENNPEYALEELMLELKFQYFGHLMRRTDSLEKTLMLGKIEGSRKRWRQRLRWLNGITDSMDMGFE